MKDGWTNKSTGFGGGQPGQFGFGARGNKDGVCQPSNRGNQSAFGSGWDFRTENSSGPMWGFFGGQSGAGGDKASNNRGYGLWADKPKPKRNFWGDVDGDGKETAWDDILGDGLLESAMAAHERERRGEPPEPEDEFLIGRRRHAGGYATTAPMGPVAVVTAVFLIIGTLAMCVVSIWP